MKKIVVLLVLFRTVSINFAQIKNDTIYLKKVTQQQVKSILSLIKILKHTKKFLVSEIFQK